MEVMGETEAWIRITDIRGNSIAFIHNFLLIKNLNHKIFLGTDLLASDWVYAKTRHEIIFNKIPGKTYNTSKIKYNENFVVIPISAGIPNIQPDGTNQNEDDTLPNSEANTINKQEPAREIPATRHQYQHDKKNNKINVHQSDMNFGSPTKSETTNAQTKNPTTNEQQDITTNNHTEIQQTNKKK